MENQEQNESLEELAKNLTENFHSERKKQRIIGILRMIAGLAIAVVGISLSLSSSAVFYGAVIFGIYWIVIGAMEVLA